MDVLPHLQLISKQDHVVMVHPGVSKEAPPLWKDYSHKPNRQD